MEWCGAGEGVNVGAEREEAHGGRKTHWCVLQVLALPLPLRGRVRRRDGLPACVGEVPLLVGLLLICIRVGVRISIRVFGAGVVSVGVVRAPRPSEPPHLPPAPTYAEARTGRGEERAMAHAAAADDAKEDQEGEDDDGCGRNDELA
ncbi:hypothetical protein FB451DRAFT_1192302 [Mycena latifolia]|nr:hypothetical protein FB451DRAFT_1192302 [Mycena latifolia]